MTRQTIVYQPALDGVRAVAVTVVLLFHGGIGWMSGGYLGVSVFFTLSGFLITSLLVAEHERSGRVAAAAFYTRRARRLLPASIVCLMGVSVAAAAGWFRGVDHLRRDVWGALFQVFNWVKLLGGESYADINAKQAGFKNPLDHYWSLAIEEQFYWLWPLAFMGLMLLARRWRIAPLTLVAALTGLAAVAAPLIAWHWGPDVAYWATPARICEILAGALAACWVAGRELPARLGHLAPVALLALLVACVLFPDGRGPAYEGALPLVATASAALIVGLQVHGPVRQLLGVRPLVALGKVSYGVYLYHWPVYVLVDRQGWDMPVGALLAIKCSITAGVATASYFLVERPIRTASWLPPRRTLVGALSATALAGALALVIVPGVEKFYGVDPEVAADATIDTGPVEPLVPLTTVTSSTLQGTVTTVVPGTGVVASTVPLPSTTSTLPVPPRPVRIVVIGDSTAEATGAGLVQWAAANPQYAQVEVIAGAGCGLSLGGFLVFSDSERDIDANCAPYVSGIVPERVAALQPDVVMLLTTTWDVADRRLVAGGPVLSSADPEARAAIAASFQSLTDQLLGLGVSRVVWVHQPIPIQGMLGPMDRQGDAARHEALYEIMDAMAAANPAVRTIDLATWVDDAGLREDTVARPDAVHWIPEVSLRIATEFLAPLLVQAALT
ncbi:MAG: acyltransferase family protein [Actinomycetota bacterium]|nr:acyltransferase family protein [Actinomycetota bacterium]